MKLPQEVVVEFKAADWDPLLKGRVTWRVGGTQKADGLFSGFRRHISGRRYQTGPVTEEVLEEGGVRVQVEQTLRRAVRVHQWFL